MVPTVRRPLRKMACCAAAALLALAAQAGGLHAQGASPGAPAPPRWDVAILPFAAVGASEPDASAATDRLHEELLRIGTATLADQGLVDAAFNARNSQPGACASMDCAVGVGQSVGARRVVTGKVTRFDETHWLVSAQLIDVERSQLLRTASLQYRGAFFDFVREGIPYLAARMAGTPPKESRGLATRLTETLNLAAGPGAAPQAGAPAGGSAGSSRERSETSRRKGFGVFTGYAQSGGTIYTKAGPSLNYSGGTVPNLGIDYQAELSSTVTLAPYLVFGAGPVSGSVATYYDTLLVDELGMEVRYWQDALYAGGRAAFYGIGFFDEKNRNTNGLILSGASLGVSGGYEAPSGAYMGAAVDYGLVYSVQKVMARKEGASVSVPLEGRAEGYTLWLNIGYRWK